MERRDGGGREGGIRLPRHCPHERAGNAAAPLRPFSPLARCASAGPPPVLDDISRCKRSSHKATEKFFFSPVFPSTNF